MAAEVVFRGCHRRPLSLSSPPPSPPPPVAVGGLCLVVVVVVVADASRPRSPEPQSTYHATHARAHTHAYTFRTWAVHLPKQACGHVYTHVGTCVCKRVHTHGDGQCLSCRTWTEHKSKQACGFSFVEGDVPWTVTRPSRHVDVCRHVCRHV